jgi:hypothetical protein
MGNSGWFSQARESCRNRARATAVLLGQPAEVVEAPVDVPLRLAALISLVAPRAGRVGVLLAMPLAALAVLLLRRNKGEWLRR